MSGGGYDEGCKGEDRGRINGVWRGGGGRMMGR